MTRGDRRLSIVGRLRDGADLADASRELDAAAARLATEFPETNKGTRSDGEEPRRFTATPYSRLDAAARGQVLLISVVVLGSTGLLLLSACVNAGSLLLSRSAARRRELAVKLALGASRQTLVRQVVVESLAISLGGAVFGLLLARWTGGRASRALQSRRGGDARHADRRLARRDRDRSVVRCRGILRPRTGAPCPPGRGRARASRGCGRDCRAQRRTVSRRHCRGAGRALHRAADCQRAHGASACRRPRRRSRLGRARSGDCAGPDARRARGRHRQGHRVSRCRPRGGAQAARRRGRRLGIGAAGRPQHESGVQHRDGPGRPGRTDGSGGERRVGRLLHDAAYSNHRGARLHRRRRARSASRSSSSTT